MYCTQSDITGQMPESELAQLTDDLSGEVIDSPILAQAIAAADALIDSYLAGAYATPLTAAPAVVVGISVDLSIWNLFTRRGIENEQRRQRQQDAIKRLTDIAKGVVLLTADRASTASGSRRIMSSSAERVFSAGVLDTY